MVLKNILHKQLCMGRERSNGNAFLKQSSNRAVEASNLSYSRIEVGKSKKANMGQSRGDPA